MGRKSYEEQLREHLAARRRETPLTDRADIQAHFADKRFVGVFGDHFDVRPMAGRHQACETSAKLIREAGGKAQVIWLPKLGIKGNTHLLMQDKNNALIARKIMERLSN